jgi:hypothetical protein
MNFFMEGLFRTSNLQASSKFKIDKLPVASKVLTPWVVGKRRQDKVVDSKKMTPAKERNADESKDSRRGVAAIEATVCGEGPRRTLPTD